MTSSLPCSCLEVDNKKSLETGESGNLSGEFKVFLATHHEAKCSGWHGDDLEQSYLHHAWEGGVEMS